MSKFLKFIVHFVIVCTIILVLALALPPFFGINTVIVDSSEKATNLPLGSVTYAIPTKVEDLEPGAPLLVEDEGKTYRYNFMSIDTIGIYSCFNEKLGSQGRGDCGTDRLPSGGDREH